MIVTSSESQVPRRLLRLCLSKRVVFGARLITRSKLREDLHRSWKSTPFALAILERHTYPEMPYFFNSPGKAHPSPLLSWKDTPILKCRIFSILLEKHTLRPCYPGKTHLLSWKDTPAILERHTCYPGKTHLLSWKDTPAILERH